MNIDRDLLAFTIRFSGADFAGGVSHRYYCKIMSLYNPVGYRNTRYPIKTDGMNSSRGLDAQRGAQELLAACGLDLRLTR